MGRRADLAVRFEIHMGTDHTMVTDDTARVNAQGWYQLYMVAQRPGEDLGACRFIDQKVAIQFEQIGYIGQLPTHSRQHAGHATAVVDQELDGILQFVFATG